MSGADYATKVPKNVQTADAEKCESLRSEINETQKAIDGIKQLIQGIMMERELTPVFSETLV